MQRVTQDMLTLIHQGVSLNKISKKYGILKSTLYYHYKKIWGKKYSEPRILLENSEIEGEIVGIFAGDGSQYYYRPKGDYQTSMHLGCDIHYVLYAKSLLESFFKKNWFICKETSQTKRLKFRLRSTNRSTYNFFSNYLCYISSHKHDTVRLRSDDMPLQFIRGFLRGLLDTDGCFSYNKFGKYLTITYSTTSLALADQVVSLMQRFRIAATVSTLQQKDRKPLYWIRVRSSCVDTFLRTISPYKARKFGPVAQLGAGLKNKQ